MCATIEQHEQGGQEDDVRGIPPRQRERADGRASLKDCGDRLPRHRLETRDVDRHDRRPIRALIPGQEIPGERERENEPEEREAGEPRELARRLIGTEHHDTQQMKHQEDDEEAGAEVVETAHEPARRRAADEPHAVVRVIGRRRVVEREDGAGQELHRDQREEHAAEREDPAGARRDLFVEQHVTHGAIARPVVDPLDQAICESPAGRHTRTRTLSSAPSTRASITWSGRGGGPSRTSPVAA